MKLEDYLKDSTIHGCLKRLTQKAKTLKAKNFPNDEEVKALIQAIMQRIKILGTEVGKRKVLIIGSAMMGEDTLLIITDAPRSEIMDLCDAMFSLDSNSLSDYFKDFERDWYVNILVDSQVDSLGTYNLNDPENDIDLIGYDEKYVYWGDSGNIEVEIKNPYLQELFHSLGETVFNRPEHMNDKCMEIYESITSLYEELEDYLYIKGGSDCEKWMYH